MQSIELPQSFYDVFIAMFGTDEIKVQTLSIERMNSNIHLCVFQLIFGIIQNRSIC